MVMEVLGFWIFFEGENDEEGNKIKLVFNLTLSIFTNIDKGVQCNVQNVRGNLY